MISFECDYNNGAHEKVLENLIKNNGAKPTPYGFDTFCERAKNRIREACGMPDAQIFFLTGGTQTNATTIDSMLYQYEGVICVGTGHINVHEAGAVEFTEHKIITLPDTQGKMEAKVLDKYLDDYMHDGNKDHAVHTRYRSISTVHVSVTDWRQKVMTSRCPIWPAIAMSSISAVRRSGHSAARQSSLPTRMPISISSPFRSSTEPSLPKGR